MERYKDFKIIGSSKSLEAYVVALKNRIFGSGWTVRDLKLSPNTPSAKLETLCVETPSTKYKAEDLMAVVWILIKDDYIEIVNIIPLSSKHLNFSQYNSILDDFRDNFVLPLKDKFELKIEESKAYFDMSDIIGENASKKLEFFSIEANKSIGRFHSCDYERWCDFISEVHKTKRRLSTDYLQNWLEEHSWSEDVAEDLALKFEFGCSLLDYYDNIIE